MGREHVKKRTVATRAVAVLVVGVVVGIVVGGALRLFGSDANGAQAAAPPGGPGGAALRRGPVAVDPAVGDLATDLAPGRTRTPDGAAAAFAAYAVWLVGSPAAAAEPEQAAGVVGGLLINPADARQVAQMQRSADDRFEAERGAYRILGHAGAVRTPDEVMVEVTAPLSLAGRTTWRTIGGVVGWTPTGWQLVSIQPRNVPQPQVARADVAEFSVADRARTLAGLGWQAFAETRR